MLSSDSKTKLKDVEAEKTVIAGLLKDEARVDKALLTCNASYFTVPLYKNLFQIVTQAFIKHSSLITNEFLSSYLELNGYDQSVRLAYLKGFDDLRAIDVTNGEFGIALAAIKRAFMANAMSDIIMAGADALDKKGGQKSYEVIETKLYDLKVSTIESANIVVVDDRKDQDLKDLLQDVRDNPEKHKGMETGWTVLDQATNGFRPGECVLIVVKSGGGKSMSLLNWANHAQEFGHNIVYFTLEMSHWEIRMRKLSLVSGLPFKAIKTQIMTPEQFTTQEAALKSMSERTAAFHVVDTPKCTVGFIEAQLRQLQQNMKIDAVFIDYLGLLKPEVQVANKQGWEIYASISNDLRELARSMKMVVVTAHQVTTDGGKKKFEDDIEIEDIALSRRIGDPMHTIVGLTWNKANEMNLSFPKCRGARIEKAKLWCDLNICKISDPPDMINISDVAIQIPDLEI